MIRSQVSVTSLDDVFDVDNNKAGNRMLLSDDVVEKSGLGGSQSSTILRNSGIYILSSVLYDKARMRQYGNLMEEPMISIERG